MTYKVISLGWGVQSFTLAAMVALGELEPVDAAIHADTTHESKLTYEFALRWLPWFEDHKLQIFTVKEPKAVQITKRDSVQTHIPAYTANIKGENGQALRSCTQRWKVAPMRKAIRKYLLSQGIKNPKKNSVEMWLGISWDESERQRKSDVKYIVNRWPLLEKHMTRQDCIVWLDKSGLEVPPKSACTFCPYHSTAEWRRIKSTPEDWAEAVAVDLAIRKARPPYDLFVHPSRKPLEDVDLRTAEEKGQLSLWDAECSGVCGV